jgi:hypothetical protein
VSDLPGSRERRAPGTAAAVGTLAAVTLRRLVRGRALWVSLLIAALPIGHAAAMKHLFALGLGHELFGFEVLVIAVLAPMFIGASIGEEVEDRTTTYLWSRPLRRWAILAGKLVALAPVIVVLVLASWSLASLVAWGAPPTGRTCGALAAGALALSLVTMGIATIGPRHGTALTICYLLFFDFPIAVLPATIQNASIAFQVNALAGMAPGAPSAGVAVLALTAIAGAWATIAVLRIRRLEA